MAQFSIGQVWQVSWVDGNEVLPSHGRTHRTRTGILTGAEAIDGKAANLHFSIPMVAGRRNNTVSASELEQLHVQGDATLIGTVVIEAPK